MGLVGAVESFEQGGDGKRCVLDGWPCGLGQGGLVRQGKPIWKLFQESLREVRVQNKAVPMAEGGVGGARHGFKIHSQGQIQADWTCRVQDEKECLG